MQTAGQNSTGSRKLEMTSNPPHVATHSGGLAAKQAAAAAAARFAGYSSFYASPSPPAQGQQQQQQFFPVRSPTGPPPPRPGMFSGPRGPPPPRPPHLANGFARPPPPQFAFNGRGPPPMMRPPPRQTPPSSSPPSTPQWQWSNGGSGQASAPAKSTTPVRFNISPQNRGPPPRSFGPPPAAFSAAKPAAPAAASPMGGNAKWPDALHDYVKRAFARCKGAADQSITQNSLKEMITNAIMTNSLWTKNWTAEPLPVLVGDTPVAAMQANVGMGGPMPGTANRFAASSPSSSSFQTNQGFVPFKEPSGKKNKANKRKHDGFEMEAADVQRKNQRKQRFHMTQQELKSLVTPVVDTKRLQVLTQDGDLDLAAMVIKGTSQTVEKEYLRLTSPPHPSTVRPEPVLHKALELVKSKWKKGDHDYIYACSQLKSIRQDCTVQHIKNEFTVRVYEAHARIALESGDINEFNQCQTQLHELYEKLIPGEAIEFLAYRILYCVYVSLQAKKGDSNAGQLGMYHVLGMVTAKLRADPAIAHALAVRQAVAMNDYHRFFKLYVDAPNMAGYLMDVMVPAIRLSALRAMCKAYRPTLPVQYIRDELKLEGKEGKAFIRQSGLAFVKGDKTRADTKASNIVWVLSNESSLI
ncbi:hypothetical protein PF005_g16131 [Phytophthora fragariae]|uniref:SAC3/GANP/THP3 conserved domain-containing protein n=1 Tax=Phytophthora fragariae TaxID=53985 RepID=A0A6A3ERM6_9STRA|nr:hypothetical protein PF009_g17278 [Phytophthora fragariae]KAE8997954.1 hypothetical protein PF011_g15255 [Phytophthora fragariae]KAE9109349.1 hypothetical protein PF006_g20689 [Phytophthora fragariae]KAE9198459.1 hypothetical protein PF005_g16131 [Phytophthora fragariae]KAE9214124.1 hypothetical protein PF002_g17759 [Phytophthora fragariae]